MAKKNKEEPVIIPEADLVVFVTSLKNGLGLTSACDLIMLDPKTMSKYLTENSATYLDCIEALKLSARALVIMASTNLENKEFDKWKINQSILKAFIPTLTLWESYCKKEDVTNEVILKAYIIHKNMGEAATSIGLYRNELVDRIITDKNLFIYFSQHSAL